MQLQTLLYNVVSVNTIVIIIKDVLVRMNLVLSRCRSQCYKGASTMAGTRNRVATQLRDKEN